MAVGGGSDRGTPAHVSLFERVRHERPDLGVVELSKSELLRLCRAIEREVLEGVDSALVFAAFQRREHFEASLDQWRQVAGVAGSVFAFADFDGVRSDRGLVEVPLPAGAAMLQEWCVVCLAPGLHVAMSARELASEPGTADRDRRFQVAVSTDPEVVQVAARVGADLAGVAGFAEARTVLAMRADDAGPRVRPVRRHLDPALARVRELTA